MTAAAITPDAGTAVSGTLNARRLLWIRMIAVPGSALCLLVAHELYGLSIKPLPLALIVLLLVGFNLWVWARLRRRVTISDRETFVHMLVDLFALTSILYYTGGAANPFVFFFLLPMVVTAAALPRIYTWFMAVISAVSYTLLLIFRVEVPEFTHRAGSGMPVDLHVIGMWLGFVVIAALIAYFVAGMAETVRERDRYLAALRESALRDEKVVAMATLAAGAAHELSTPLATMAVLTGEMAAEYPEPQFGPLHRQLAILRDQVGRCKEALSVLSASAGAVRADSAIHQQLDEFVVSAVTEVRRLRPGAVVTVQADDAGGRPPSVVIERTVRQALLNVLHNAVDASPDSVRVEWRWDADAVEVSVIDRGGGLLAGKPVRLDRPQVSTKEGGLGLGLFLSQAAISQLGGELLAESNFFGGTTVRMHLPLTRLVENHR